MHHAGTDHVHHEALGLLDGLSRTGAEALERSVREIRLPPLSTIFKEGDPGDALYIIKSGLIDVVAEAAGRTTRLVTLGPGEVFGEQALITGQPRSASAITQTGATLWRLDHADFLALIVSEPQLAANVARIVSERLHAATRGRLGLPRGQTVVFWGGRAQPVASAARTIAAAAARMIGERPVVLAAGPAESWGRTRLPAGAEVLDHEELVGAAVRLVREHTLVIILCTPEIPAELLFGADRVVAFGDDLAFTDTEGRVRGGPVSVLPARPSADRLGVLARELCGRRIGVALGSGGVRGFAHAGVIKVLISEGVPIDFLAGASAGAIAGVLWLSGWTAEQLADIPNAMMEAVKTGLPSLSLSPRAILSGRRMHTFLRSRVGKDTTFEDLPVPFLVACTDLDSRAPVHLDSGILADAVAASAAVPGIFPPLTIGGHRLVDGGVSDPVPVNALRARGADIVIAVNVMAIGKGPLGVYTPRIRIPMPGLLENLLIGFDTVASQLSAKACQLADIVVEPAGADVHWYEVVPARRYMRAGERAMQLAMPEIRRLLGD